MDVQSGDQHVVRIYGCLGIGGVAALDDPAYDDHLGKGDRPSPDSPTVIVVSGMRSMVLMQTDHVTPETRVLVCDGLFVVRDRLDLVR